MYDEKKHNSVPMAFIAESPPGRLRPINNRCCLVYIGNLRPSPHYYRILYLHV